MATLSGTQVIAKVVPVDSLDTYPTHDELYGKGGYRTVATTIVRDAIPADRRSVGMLVYVTANSHFYTLDANLTSWTDKGDLTGGAFASQPEAEAGTDTIKYMNPLRTAQAIFAQIIAGTNITKTPVPGGVQLDASATGSMEYVFWQASPTQTGVLFNDWEDMCAAILALPNGVAPFITFKENFTIPLVNMPVGGWDMRGAAWESPLIATGNVTITIPDGVIIDNLVSIEQGLAVECNPTTTDGVFLHSAYAGLQILVVDFGANLYNLGSKALIDQTGQVVIALNGASTLGAGPANVGPWVKANTANTVLAIMVVASGSTGFPDGWIVGGVPGSVLLYQHGITFTDPVITWAGDAPIYLNSSQAKNLPYDNGASGLTATQVQAAIDELAGMGGGGGTGYTADNTVYVDSAATPIAGIVFNDFATADTYVQTQTPAANNTWCIQFAAGTYTDNIIARPYVTIRGQGNSTVLGGTTTGGIAFAEIAALGMSNIENCMVENLIGTASKIVSLTNCMITGGVTTSAVFVCQVCTIDGNLNTGAALNFNALFCFISGAALTCTSASYDYCSLTQGSGVTLTIGNGRYNHCAIGTLEIINSISELTFLNCSFGNNVVLNTYTAGTLVFVNCSSENLLTFTLNGATLYKFSENTNIIINNTAYSSIANKYETKKVKYYSIDVSYTDLAIAATTNTITLNATIPAFARVLNVVSSVTAQFSGGTIATLIADIGTTASPAAFITAQNILVAPSGTSFVDNNYCSIVNTTSISDLVLTVASTGDTLDNLAGGTLRIIMTYEELI